MYTRVLTWSGAHGIFAGFLSDFSDVTSVFYSCSVFMSVLYTICQHGRTPCASSPLPASPLPSPDPARSPPSPPLNTRNHGRRDCQQRANRPVEGRPGWLQVQGVRDDVQLLHPQPGGARLGPVGLCRVDVSSFGWPNALRRLAWLVAGVLGQGGHRAPLVGPAVRLGQERHDAGGERPLVFCGWVVSLVH